MNELRGLWRGKTLLKTNPEEAFNNVWVRGDLIEANGKKYIHPKTNDVKVTDTDLGKLIVMHEVIPSTLGECTCVPDMNGKPIFEGDICTVATSNIADDEYGVVKYDEDEAVFIIDFGTYTINFCDNINGSAVEDIGNIHDNPEFIGNNWIATAEQLPPENQVVYTKIDDENGIRNETQLIFYKNLWWLPDKSIYVYYTPTHWKYEEERTVKHYDSRA